MAKGLSVVKPSWLYVYNTAGKHYNNDANELSSTSLWRFTSLAKTDTLQQTTTTIKTYQTSYIPIIIIIIDFITENSHLW